MQELVKAISARTRSDFDDAWPNAQSELEAVFDPAVWGIRESAADYSDANYGNIWRNELRASVRRALEENGADQDDFAEWLGGIHYVSVAVYRKVLFEPYQDNRGWRILLLSVPAVDAAAVGLASHYQNAQNHDHLGRVSGLLFDHLSPYAKGAGLALPGRKVKREDWTEDSLFPASISEVAGATLPADDGGGRLFMRDVRTTTVKKILASMISVKPIDLTQADGVELSTALTELQALGRAVA
jgi:5-methylcytosine-specific restriction protein B